MATFFSKLAVYSILTIFSLQAGFMWREGGREKSRENQKQITGHCENRFYSQIWTKVSISINFKRLVVSEGGLRRQLFSRYILPICKTSKDKAQLLSFYFHLYFYFLFKPKLSVTMLEHQKAWVIIKIYIYIWAYIMIMCKDMTLTSSFRVWIPRTLISFY